MSTQAANDTTPVTTLEHGHTVESPTWRAHRFATHIRVTDLRNAGKRGKVCAVFDLGGEAQLPAVAPFVYDAVMGGVSLEAMASTLADVALCGMRFERHEQKGISVHREPAIEVCTDLVDCTFTSTETLCRFTWLQEWKGSTNRHDTIVGTQNRQDAAKAYQWAKANASRLVTMTLTAFRAEMDAIGVRIS